MHELLDVRPWPRVLLRYPLLILTALLLGALAAFSYSYAPLHRAKDWKIDYLEERLESRNEQVRNFEEDLAQAQASIDGTPSGEEVRALRSRLAEATRLAESREKEITSLERKLEKAAKSRDQWKSRHSAAAAEVEKLEKLAKSAPATSERVAMPPQQGDDPVPAAPAGTAAERSASTDETRHSDAPTDD